MVAAEEDRRLSLAPKKPRPVSPGGVLGEALRTRPGGLLVKQIRRTHFQRLRCFPNGQEGRILAPSFHAAYKSPIDTHPLCHGFLTEAEGLPKLARISSKYPTNIHPQDRRGSRILALRVIIRGISATFHP